MCMYTHTQTQESFLQATLEIRKTEKYELMFGKGRESRRIEMFRAFEMIISGWLRMVAQALFTEDTTNESPSVVLISVSCCWNSLQGDLKNVFLQRTKQTKVIFSPREVCVSYPHADSSV